VTAVVLIFSYIVFPFSVSANESPEIEKIKQYIQQRVEQDGVVFIDEFSEKLKNVVWKSDNFYVATQVQLLRLRLDDTYGKWLEEVWGAWKWKDKKFVLADGTRFSQGKSELTPSQIRDEEKKIVRTRTASPKPSSSPQEEVTVIKTETRGESNTANAQWAASVGVEITLNEWWTIDVARVQRAWQWRVNELRASRNLPTIAFDTTLHKTATDRALTIRNKQSADHKRFANSPYYSYPEITAWFKQRWVTFKNIARATYTENIGRAGFYCTSGDCTDEAITSLKRTYDYFRAEEWQVYDDHWRTMIHPLFGVMWVGIAADDLNDKIYISIHYGTEVE